MANLSYNNYTGQLVFRYPLPITQYNNPNGYYGLSYYGQCCCCCADLCYNYSWPGKYACCCGLPNPTTGRTDLEVDYSGSNTYSFSISCEGGYSNGCTCISLVYTSEMSDNIPDNPCCVTITIHELGWVKSFYPFSIECCCECDPIPFDNYFEISYCCPTKSCPSSRVETYIGCCCCDDGSYSPTLQSTDIYTYVDTKNCYEHVYEVDRDYSFSRAYCSTCNGSVSSFSSQIITYTYTIYDPDNCCRFCIPPLVRYRSTPPYDLMSTEYWSGNSTTLSCGTWPCVGIDGGSDCITDYVNYSDCNSYCGGGPC